MNLYHIKKILVPVDLSETSLNALNSAVLLAKQHKASIRILNVVEPLFSKDVNGNFLHYPSKTNADVLSAMAATVQHTNELKPRLTQINGHVVECIVTTSMAEQCDLIVMGTHGASGYREGFIGTNAYHVIKYSCCPVLLIPPKRKPSLFGKILFPVRPTTGSLMRYDIISNFLSSTSRLDLLEISHIRMERDTSVMDKIVQEIRGYSSVNKVKVNISWGQGISIADDILQHAKQTSPELIVLSLLLDATTKVDFIGPQVQRVIHCSRIPTLYLKQLEVPILS